MSCRLRHCKSAGSWGGHRPCAAAPAILRVDVARAGAQPDEDACPGSRCFLPVRQHPALPLPSLLSPPPGLKYKLACGSVVFKFSSPYVVRAAAALRLTIGAAAAAGMRGCCAVAQLWLAPLLCYLVLPPPPPHAADVFAPLVCRSFSSRRSKTMCMWWRCRPQRRVLMKSSSSSPQVRQGWLQQLAVRCGCRG